MKKSECKNKDVVYYKDPDLDKVFKDYIADRKEAKKDLTSRAIKEHMEKLKEIKRPLHLKSFMVSILEGVLLKNTAPLPKYGST